ncbi:hypothetical protein LXA47_08355 [Massilia sp. P8910]|uniref:hypothetical protein n=1 Tax=Massilia antarctica TaxID=2765360 RepID=UPI001E5BBE8E|nr:hypothetical protein [Massilia antarctica]MCE3603617.1 hypothetical protein [Massilia antarctica]
MIPPSFVQILWATKRLVLAQSWTTRASVSILSVCALVMAMVVMPADGKLRATQLKIAAVRAAPAIGLTPAQRGKINRQTEADEFLRMFPPHDAELEAMGKIYGAAEFWKVELHEGEYRRLPEKAGKLSRLEIVLPVRGNYIAIRKFLAQTLVDVPTLSLDSVNFRREKIDDPHLEATLRLTLFLSSL